MRPSCQTNVRPAKCGDLRCPQSRCGAGQHEGKVQQVLSQAPKDGHGLSRNDQDGRVGGLCLNLDLLDWVLENRS